MKNFKKWAVALLSCLAICCCAIGVGVSFDAVTADAARHTHVYDGEVDVVKRDPTCTAKGYGYDYCSVDGCTMKRTVWIAATGHCDWEDSDYIDIYKEPTCTAKGHIRYECSYCEKMVSLREKAEHDFTDWVILKEATCTQTGKRARICIDCGKREYEVTQKLAHTYSYAIEEREATCTKTGRLKFVCEDCGKTVYETTPKLGHNIIEVDGQAATCTEYGWRDYKECDRCDYSTYKEIKAKGHSWKKYTADPLCQEDGHAEYFECKTCGVFSADKVEVVESSDGFYYTEEEVANAKHTYKVVKGNLTCTACDKEFDGLFYKVGKDLYETLDAARENLAEDDVILPIYNAEDLLQFADEVNAGEPFTDVYVQLQQNVTLTDEICVIGSGDVAFEGVFDGNNKKIIEKDIDYSYRSDCVFTILGGYVMDLKIICLNGVEDGGTRGIGSGSTGKYKMNADLYLDNVYVDGGVYGINIGNGNDYSLIAVDSTFYGWNSYDGLASAEFTDCTFGYGDTDYAKIRMYNYTIFEGCNFKKGVTLDAGEENFTLILEDCKYDNKEITANNFDALLENDDYAENLKTCFILVDDTVLVYNQEVLQRVAQFIVDGESFEGYTIQLQNDIVLTEDICVIGSDEVAFAGTLDGNGYALIEEAIDYKYRSDCLLAILGGNVENLEISLLNGAEDGGTRGIGSGSTGTYKMNADLILNNVYVDGGVYAINIGNGNGYSLIAVNSTFYGWNSYAGLDAAFFSGCTFGYGDTDYAKIRMYNDTIFEGCNFKKGVTLDAAEENLVVYFENCYYGEEKITADNFDALLENDEYAENLKTCFILVDDTVLVYNQEALQLVAQCIVDGVSFEDYTIQLQNDIVLTEDICVIGSDEVAFAGTLDGNGYALIEEAIDYSYRSDCLLAILGGNVENLEISLLNGKEDGGTRGIGSGSTGKYEMNADLYLDNVTIDGGVYAINIGIGNDHNLIVTNSTLYGWTSYSGLASAEFTDCTFGKGESTQQYLRMYDNTVFENCTFEEGFKIGAVEEDLVVYFENCYYGEEKITVENFEDLLLDAEDSDAETLKNCKVIINGVLLYGII